MGTIFGGTILPVTGCEYKGEHPKQHPLRRDPQEGIPTLESSTEGRLRPVPLLTQRRTCSFAGRKGTFPKYPGAMLRPFHLINQRPSKVSTLTRQPAASDEERELKAPSPKVPTPKLIKLKP